MKKNYLYNLSYQILILIVPLLIIPYLTKTVGIEGIGVYNYTFSIANYFVLATMLGMNIYGSRSIAKLDVNKKAIEFWSIYSVQICTFLLSLLFFILLNLGFEDQYQYYMWLQLPLLLSSLFDVNWFFIGKQNFKLIVMRNTIIKMLTLICIFKFVNNKDDIDIYLSIMSVSYLISNLIMWPSLIKEVGKPVFIKDKHILKKHFKSSLVLFVPVISISIYKLLDKIMLANFSDIYEVGYYSTALQINLVQTTIIASLGVVMMPKMSELNNKIHFETIRKIIRNSMQFSLFLSFGLSIGIYTIAPYFINLYLGIQYSYVSQLVQILAPVGIIIAWANVIRTQVLLPRGLDKFYLWSILSGALINVTLNIIFIPKFGAFAAVYSTLFTELVVMFVQTILLRKQISIYDYLSDSLIVIPSGLSLYFMLNFLLPYFSNSYMKLMFSIVISSIVYFTVYIFLFRYTASKRFNTFYKKTNIGV